MSDRLPDLRGIGVDDRGVLFAVAKIEDEAIARPNGQPTATPAAPCVRRIFRGVERSLDRVGHRAAELAEVQRSRRIWSR
jgi:hypothetical protein